MNQPFQTELNPGEFHPLAPAAFAFVKRQGAARLMQLAEALASTALSGNKTAAICWGTLDRILTGQGVSDRYVFGLAWLIMTQEGADERPLEACSRELATALRDALSIYQSDGEHVVTGERIEAWQAALAAYDGAKAKADANKAEGDK